MATTAFKAAAKKIYTEANLLLEIDLIGNGVHYDSTRTIYLSSKVITVEGVVYEPIVLDFGDIDFSTEQNEGLSSINDTSITLANHRLSFMDTDIKFSDLFNDYYFAGSKCRIYQWFGELSLKSDAELKFTGIVKQPSFNRNEVTLDIEDDESVLLDIPVNVIMKNDFPYAPKESIGKAIPIIYGTFIGEFGTTQPTPYVTPCIKTNDAVKQFYICDKQIADPIVALSNIFMYLDDVDKYGYLSGDIVYTNDNNGSRFTLDNNIDLTVYLCPKIKGSLFSCAVTDWNNILDFNSNTYITLNSGESFYLKFDNFLTQGNLESKSTTVVDLVAYISNVSGTPPGGIYGKIYYYNAGYNAGSGGKSAGENITGNTAFTKHVLSDRTAHGIQADKSDDADIWTLDELSGYEYGIEVSAGCSFRLSRFYLELGKIPLMLYKPKSYPSKRKKK
jgi:hypothetical protein